MKKSIYIVLAVIMIITACTKDLSELNVDPKNPSSAPSYALVTNAQRSLSNTLTSANINLNIFRLIIQHWNTTQYPDESNYDLGNREINDNVWDALYRDALRDLQEAKTLIPTDVQDPAVQQNQLAIVDILEVYTYYYLVTTYGDIPYTQALDINQPFPVYDDAATIYADLLTRLDAAIADLDPAAASFGAADIIYGGVVSDWIRFANSFKLKMGMTIADVNPALARTTVESAVAAGVLTSNAQNAEINYQGAPPNTNPIWVDLVQSGRDDFVAASTLVNTMNTLLDPRRDNYFTTDPTGNYSGAEPGTLAAYAQFSHVNPVITQPTFPGLLLDYSEVEFLLAEAVERGFNVGGTAPLHYNNAVTASITYWGGTEVEATTYLTQASVNYVTAPGDYRQKIGVQKWIALFNRSFDAWIEWRRLDAPDLEPAVDAISEIPVRYPYPVNEQNVNRANVEAAGTAIGGDDVATNLWWDVL
ncbi:MAG TPA: SusD/RagB family nutrient-binding outer membrane lipoprotein [Sphingobacteriaceae bacterium]